MYNEAAAEVKYLLDQIDWASVSGDGYGYTYDHDDNPETPRVEAFPYRAKSNDDDASSGGLTPPYVNLLSFGYTVVGRTSTSDEPQYTDNPTAEAETDWIAVSRFGGEEINSMDGFTGISRQIVRVSLFSLDRARVSIMADQVVGKINNFTGRTRPHNEMNEPQGLEFQCCLLDEVFDNNDEESSTNGMDMFFVVVVSG